MRLVEHTVQKVAQKHLEKRYRWKSRGKLFSQLEVRTKKEFGGKRADGFLAFRRWFGGVYTVSMEAKSYKTLPAVKPYYDTNRFLRSCANAGLLFMLVTGAAFHVFTLDDGFVQYLLPFVMFLIGALCYGLVSFSSYRNYKMPVIDQIAQYPANEQWLAFSSDTLSDISNEKVKKLKAICYRQGVGLILVQSSKRVKVVLQPQKKWRWWGDYLRFYAKEKEIRKVI